jgi:hypothetical protein
MSDLHIEELLLRYSGTEVTGERLRDIVERAMEFAASRLGEATGATELRAGPVTADFRVMSDSMIAERLADAIVMKLDF